jgi:hypothetical protein
VAGVRQQARRFVEVERTWASQRGALSPRSIAGLWPARPQCPALNLSARLGIVCGIHGIYRFDGLSVEPGYSLGHGRRTRHRGPDDEGQHIDGDCGIAMRRLSIIDLAGGHQPMSTPTASLWLVCNGEIYNFRELRRELQAGLCFKTGSDCEVLLHLYDAEGDDFVQRLNGMFDFALWDARRRRLLIGRDRLGVKPAVRLQDGSAGFCHRSEGPAGPARCQRRARPAGAGRDYLHLGYVPRPAASSRASASCLRPRCWRWRRAGPRVALLAPADRASTGQVRGEWAGANARASTVGADADGQ